MGLIGWRLLTRLTCFVCRYVFALSSLVWCAVVVDSLVLYLVVRRLRRRALALGAPPLSWPVAEDDGSVVFRVLDFV